MADHADMNFVNPIERVWSFLTESLAGGLTISPELPKNSTNEDIANIYDEANKLLSSFWDGMDYDGFKVSCYAVPCLEEDNELYQPDSYLESLSKKTEDEKIEIVKVIIQHCDKRADLLSFISQSHKAHCNHCSAITTKSPKLLDCLDNFGCRFPFPIESLKYKGHKQTFLEMYMSPLVIPVLKEGIFKNVF